MRKIKPEQRKYEYDGLDLKTAKARVEAFAERTRERFAASLKIKCPHALGVLAGSIKRRGDNQEKPSVS